MHQPIVVAQLSPACRKMVEPCPYTRLVPCTAVRRDVAAFARVLREAKTDDGFLTLPEGVFFPGTTLPCESIMLRDAYVRMWDLIKDETLAGRTLGWVVTGTPGIGKSTLALYIMYCLALLVAIFVYEFTWDSSRPSRVRVLFDFSQPDVTVRFGGVDDFAGEPHMCVMRVLCANSAQFRMALAMRRTCLQYGRQGIVFVDVQPSAVLQPDVQVYA